MCKGCNGSLVVLPSRVAHDLKRLQIGLWIIGEVCDATSHGAHDGITPNQRGRPEGSGGATRGGRGPRGQLCHFSNPNNNS